MSHREGSTLKVILSIEADKVVGNYRDAEGLAHQRRVRSEEDLDAFIWALSHDAGGAPVVVFASSTLDFPEEYTRDEETIRLARELRIGGE